MTHERYPPDDPREWLNRARSNLAQAKARSRDVYFEDLCFQCQQAAEKALKGLLVQRNVRFPYTHDISLIMEILEQSGLEVPKDLQEAVILSRFASATRYPNVVEEVTEAKYEEALRLADGVLRWAESLIQRH